MLLGIIFYLLSIYFGTVGAKVYHFWLSLFFCGLGWNFLYVGGSSVIAHITAPEERGRVQGIADFCIFSLVALASMFSGMFHSEFGWKYMIYISFAPIILILTALCVK